MLLRQTIRRKSHIDQLPPTGGLPIPELAMHIESEKYSHDKYRRIFFGDKKELELTSVSRQGVEQFIWATLINLTEQHRSEDQEHTDLLCKMSAGESIGPEDLNNYKTLLTKDTQFQFATILTTGNKEHHKFNNIQARRWTEKHGTYLVRWPRLIKNWKGKPTNPLHVNRVKQQDSCFWELYPHKALGYLTHNLNVNKGLANGDPERGRASLLFSLLSVSLGDFLFLFLLLFLFSRKSSFFTEEFLFSWSSF
jgi:hypothetical protein